MHAGADRWHTSQGRAGRALERLSEGSKLRLRVRCSSIHATTASTAKATTATTAPVMTTAMLLPPLAAPVPPLESGTACAWRGPSAWGTGSPVALTCPCM